MKNLEKSKKKRLTVACSKDIKTTNKLQQDLTIEKMMYFATFKHLSAKVWTNLVKSGHRKQQPCRVIRNVKY